MILGSLAARMFGLTGKSKIITEILVGAMEIGLLLTLGIAAYPAEAIAIKAATVSVKSICHKKLKKIAKSVMSN